MTQQRSKAFQQLKEKGVLYFENEGKNRGCWVMARPSASAKANAARTADDRAQPANEKTSPDEDAKVIVRSNGTVGYVGKDIAYHLWKFGLLPGKDFGYAKFREYLNVLEGVIHDALPAEEPKAEGAFRKRWSPA